MFEDKVDGSSQEVESRWIVLKYWKAMIPIWNPLGPGALRKITVEYVYLKNVGSNILNARNCKIK